MKSKWLLFAGIIFLVIGIVLRRISDFSIEGLVLIITGVLLKAFYIIRKIRSGEYIPGFEMGFLFIGLAMFLSGLYLRAHQAPFNPAFLIAPGLLLKVGFIVIFIVKTKRVKSI